MLHFAFHYQYALACASCRPLLCILGGGTDFDALFANKLSSGEVKKYAHLLRWSRA